MPGFIDRSAPSVLAEYSRYIDGDMLGKLLAKNLLVNRLGFLDDAVEMQLARHGDASTRYEKGSSVRETLTDGYVQTDRGRISLEIKCARVNLSNRMRGLESRNWVFYTYSEVHTKLRRIIIFSLP